MNYEYKLISIIYNTKALTGCHDKLDLRFESVMKLFNNMSKAIICNIFTVLKF